MRVVLNFVPVNSGGGQKQALNFIGYLEGLTKVERERWMVLVGEGTTLHQTLLSSNILTFRALKTSYIRRFFADHFIVQRILNEFDADIVYHYTVAWKGVRIPQVVRSVYSNLYFPELQFWEKRPVLSYFKKKVIDWFRLSGTLRADGLIFENKSMQARSEILFKFPLDRTCYICPSREDDEKVFENYNIRKKNSRNFRILYLSSWYFNKNIHILPDVAFELQQQGVFVSFVLTLDSCNTNVKSHIIERSVKLGVENYFELVGTVHPSNVRTLVEDCDCMILLSQLECFSNNVVEAWSYKKPLIISDMEWARSECLDAALYVNRNDPRSISDAILRLVGDVTLSSLLVGEGLIRLRSFNSLDSKCAKQVEFLEYIHSVGKRS